MGSTWLQFFTVAVPVLLSLVTGLFGWLRWRRKGETEAQIVLNNTFTLLVNEMKAENSRLQAALAEESRELYALQAEFRAHRIEYDIARIHVRSLEQFIVGLGAVPPLRPEEIVEWSLKGKPRSLPPPEK